MTFPMALRGGGEEREGHHSYDDFLEHDVLIIGGGPAGLATAVSLGQLGHRVIVLERSDRTGGRLRRIDRLYPDMTPAAEVLDGLEQDVARQSNITVRTGADVLSIAREGERWTAELAGGSKVTARAVVAATGLELFDASRIPEYGFGRLPGVVTSEQMEGMLREGKVLIPGTAEAVGTAVFVQCVGSRTERRGVRYCSATCCANAVKQAIQVRDLGAEAFVLYIDLRLTGKGQEDLYREARSKGVRFIRGIPGLIVGKDGRLMVCGENTLLRELYEIEADLVVLGTGVRQSASNLLLLDTMEVRQTTAGFPAVDGCRSSSRGVFISGSAEGPKDLRSAVQQGRACAWEVHAYLRT